MNSVSLKIKINQTQNKDIQDKIRNSFIGTIFLHFFCIRVEKRDLVIT